MDSAFPTHMHAQAHASTVTHRCTNTHKYNEYFKGDLRIEKIVNFTSFRAIVILSQYLN